MKKVDVEYIRYIPDDSCTLEQVIKDNITIPGCSYEKARKHSGVRGIRITIIVEELDDIKW